MSHKDPYGMEYSELKPQFKKWEEILKANVICRIGNRDHINAYLCYMLYSLSTLQLGLLHGQKDGGHSRAWHNGYAIWNALNPSL